LELQAFLENFLHTDKNNHVWTAYIRLGYEFILQKEENLPAQKDFADK